MHLPTVPNLAAAARNWSVESQQVSRRNAMLASTQCAQRRAERQEVADYFAAQNAPRRPAQRSAAPQPNDAPVRAAQR
ncbi:MAG: hypothetical protein M3237_12165 [Actinomycetota bacterium]|nr:hypothetical protein [Actinomycetota bacterium]